MRKRWYAVFLVIVLTLDNGIQAFSENYACYSIQAANQFCGIWNDCLFDLEKNIKVNYKLSDDFQRITIFEVLAENWNVGLKYDFLPADAKLYFTYDVEYGIYGFGIISDNMDSDLEEAVIYTDDEIYNNIKIGSGHKSLDMWCIFLYQDEVLDILEGDQFTVKLTINGKDEIIDISTDSTVLFYDLIILLTRFLLYTDQNFRTYLSTAFLPGGGIF